MPKKIIVNVTDEMREDWRRLTIPEFRRQWGICEITARKALGQKHNKDFCVNPETLKDWATIPQQDFIKKYGIGYKRARDTMKGHPQYRSPTRVFIEETIKTYGFNYLSEYTKKHGPTATSNLTGLKIPYCRKMWLIDYQTTRVNYRDL